MFGNTVKKTGNTASLINSLINTIMPSENKPGSAGSIFKEDDKDLVKSYDKLSNNSDSINPNQKEKAKNNLIIQMLKADLEDDGEINGSIVKDKNKSSEVANLEKNLFQKENFIKLLLKMDEQDDGKINGSIFHDKSIRLLLDKMDDGEINSSIDEFSQFLKEDNYKDNEIYNIFGEQDQRTQSRIFGNYRRPEVSYNSTDFRGNSISKQNTVKPAEIQGNGTAANAAKIALGEIGNKESDGSFKKYTGGNNEAWCADFVNWSYKKATGGNTPWGKDVHSVDELKQWGQSNGLYSAQKDGKGIKPGDIAIFKSAGASHTGIVTKVDEDGVIHTIEGNTSDKVAERSYNPGNSRLSGFVKMNDLEKEQPS